MALDEALVRRLLRKQFPPLPERPVAPLSEGWDYAVFSVDGEWVFRSPRRPVVVPGTEREIATLGRIAPLLPAPLPEPSSSAGPARRSASPPRPPSSRAARAGP